jgi:hypothetical protein
VGEFVAKAIDHDEYDHVPRGATFVSVSRPMPRATQALEFLTEHFAVVSALAAVVVFLCTTVSLYSYLSTFDWRLIWVVEYSDVFKASLIALALISSLAITLYGLMSAFMLFSANLSNFELLMAASISMVGHMWSRIHSHCLADLRRIPGRGRHVLAPAKYNGHQY